ncbi:hypothetical protein ACWEQG_01785 [Microbispora sp. NPDC004025]
MSPYTKAWLIWGGVTAGGFAVIEGLALASGDMANTLSAHLRLALGLDPARRWGVIGGLAFTAACVWLIWHIVIDRSKKAR